jgi:hypothetical protein
MHHQRQHCGRSRSVRGPPSATSSSRRARSVSTRWGHLSPAPDGGRAGRGGAGEAFAVGFSRVGPSQARGGWPRAPAASVGASYRPGNTSLAGGARCVRTTGSVTAKNARCCRPDSSRGPGGCRDRGPTRASTVAGWPSAGAKGAAWPVTSTGAAMTASSGRFNRGHGPCGYCARHVGAPHPGSGWTAVGAATGMGIGPAARPPRVPARRADNSPRDSAAAGAPPATCTGIGMAANGPPRCGSADGSS